MSDKFEIVAKTFQGLETVLADELRDLGAENVEMGRRMVSFTGDKLMLYKANFCCRTALRILKPFYTFKASDADELYEQVKKIDWDLYLKVDQTFSIDSTVYSEEFRHSKFVTYRVKDAIVDFFSEKYEKRPSIRLQNPDVIFNVHISGDNVTLSLDSSGESLHKRGYRVAQTEAPINEVLAAGLLKLAGWDGKCNLVDPMCGSGTFLIEAALIATNIYPGIYRTTFAFERWDDFDQELFESLYNDDSQERDFEFKIYGSDISPKAIDIANSNIKNAGVGKYIETEVKSFQNIISAPDNGMLISNPPYGERLSYDDMEQFYRTIGNKLKNVYKGYQAWLIGPQTEIFDLIGLKPSLKFPILNGSLECELREYVIFDGAYSDFRKDGNSVKNESFNTTDIPKRRAGGDRDRKSGDRDRKFGDRDRKSGDRDRKFGDRDRKSGDRDRKFGDRDRKFGDRDRKFGDRDNKFGDRDRKFGDRDRKFGDRDRKFGDRDNKFGERDRKFGDRDNKFGDRDRKFGDRDSKFGDDNRKFGDSRFGDRDRKFGDRKFGDRDRKFGDRDRKFGDRDNDRKFGDKGPRKFGDDSANSARGERKIKPYGHRPEASAPRNPLEERYRKPYSSKFDDRDRPRRDDNYSGDKIHGDEITDKIVKYRKPTLGKENEVPIMRGRRNAWKRSSDTGEKKNSSKSGKKE